MAPDDLAAVLARARSHATIDMADCAALLTVSLHRMYGMAKEQDSVLGVPVLHVGAKTLRIPARPILGKLGLLDDTEGTP